ncbi:MAG: phosphoglucomutase/phosphomannomutase family protein [Bacteroidota bacterium]
MAQDIKFGTDGWRAIIGEAYTTQNVARLSEAVALWAKKKNPHPRIAISYDCRKQGRHFAETAAKVFVGHEIQVYLSPSFTSTPAVSLAVKELDLSCGVVITASHNPPNYSGFKLKGSYGGPLQEEDLETIERLIPDSPSLDFNQLSLESNFCAELDIEERYIEAIRKRFDIASIRKSGLQIAVDSMYGSGQNIWRKLIPGIHVLRGEVNPSFDGISPEPILKNLGVFQDFLKKNKGFDLGIANDGDADRIALFDGKGNYIDSHHVILLLINYLAGHQGKKGKVVTAFSSVKQIESLCAHYDLPIEIVKIGFKYAAQIMLKEEVIVSGEESGGIAVDGLIPERDGIWSALVILEFLQKTGKSIEQLIQEVYNMVGTFHFERRDLHIKKEKKEEVISKCEAGQYVKFGDFDITQVEDLDGWKFWLSDNDWVMIRPSGTEPILRVYVQSSDSKKCKEIFKNTLQALTIV